MRWREREGITQRKKGEEKERNRKKERKGRDGKGIGREEERWEYKKEE